ncbi:MAG TPA: cyclic nucleotide-binding domain-containing protein [Chromatiales bacterium]|nr:cyclic nucleotide-binding domain-containing protein [Chromatiales bacterium]
MSNEPVLDIERLRQLEPLANLSGQRLQELLPLAEVERLEVGMSLFREGDIDNQTVYLLAGDVQLVASDGKTDRVVSARAPEARHPLDDSQPRHVSATAITPVVLVRFDNNVLEYMMMWDQLAVSEATPDPAPAGVRMPSPDRPGTRTAASPRPHPAPPPRAKTVLSPEPASGAAVAAQAEPVSASSAPAPVGNGGTQATSEAQATPARATLPGEDRSWIRKMKHIMAFKAMPPANLKPLLERMESIRVRKGENLIEQGKSGDYYYVLTEGEARVTRMVELAMLKPGSSFGEEALLSGSVRNASVSMLTDGVVMRLSREDFNELLKEPLLSRLAPEEARLREAKGARWLDVRHAREYHHSHLPGAINIPLHELRLRMDELDKATPYICYCGTGRRSSAAAFLLAQNGFEVSVLNGGVRVMAQDLRRAEGRGTRDE